MSITQIARNYRDQSGRTGGYVVIYQGKVAGWADALDRPASWLPGAIAVDDWGRQWVAAGGNHYSGALRWEPLSKEPAEVTHEKQAD